MPEEQSYLVNEKYPYKFKVSVSQEDIDNGVRNSCMRCPVARAVARAFVELQIDVNAIRVYHYIIVDGFYAYRIPREAKDFIDSFDRPEPDQVFAPFEFEAEFAAFGDTGIIDPY